jgi:hypothetical protein
MGAELELELKEVVVQLHVRVVREKESKRVSKRVREEVRE